MHLLPYMLPGQTVYVALKFVYIAYVREGGERGEMGEGEGEGGREGGWDLWSKEENARNWNLMLWSNSFVHYTCMCIVNWKWVHGGVTKCALAQVVCMWVIGYDTPYCVCIHVYTLNVYTSSKDALLCKSIFNIHVYLVGDQGISLCWRQLFDI